jgi:hypothetical protein
MATYARPRIFRGRATTYAGPRRVVYYTYTWSFMQKREYKLHSKRGNNEMKQQELNEYIGPTFTEAGPQNFSRRGACIYLETKWGLTYTFYTLAAYAARGIGPVFYKAGLRAVYTREALDEWAQTKLTNAASKASELKPMKGGVSGQK